MEAGRRLAVNPGFQVVAAAGQAARFGFALAEARQAQALVFFEPWLDCIPDDVRVDLSGLDETLVPYQPVTGTLDERDSGPFQEALLEILRDTAGPDSDPAELEQAEAMFRDHADEFFADLQATAAAAAAGDVPPDPPWLQRPWLDRLAGLPVPVTAVVATADGYHGDAITRRAQDAEIAVARSGLMTPAQDRARAAGAILRMLDRCAPR